MRKFREVKSKSINFKANGSHNDVMMTTYCMKFHCHKHSSLNFANNGQILRRVTKNSRHFQIYCQLLPDMCLAIHGTDMSKTPIVRMIV